MNDFRPLKPFSQKELLAIKAEFIRQSNAAAQGKPESMPWFDSLIAPWQGSLVANQPVVILDFGGSYLRLGVMVSKDGQTIDWLEPVKTEKNVTEYPSTQIFIKWLTQKTEPLLKKYRAKYLGFIYSHAFDPVKFHGHITGKPTVLSKAFYIPDVIGKDIGKLFLRTLEGRGNNIERLVMLNDSIALVLCARSPMGLIVATGGNICSIHPRLKNLRNLEAGEFSGIPHTTSSQIIDLNDNPGHYLMEKQSTGKYQVENLAYSCLLAGFNHRLSQAIMRQRFSTGSLIVSQTAQNNFSLLKEFKLSGEDKKRLSLLSRLILERSWQMWSAGIAALIELNQPSLAGQTVKIPVTGGVMLNDQFYFDGFSKSLGQITRQPFELVGVPDPVKGAAVAALME